MLFSTVRSYECSQDIENKLRLNLSNHAFYVLSYDADVFENEGEEKRVSSALINRVFSCYKDAAAASAAEALRAKREELTALLQGVPGLEGAVERMLADYREKVRDGVARSLAERGNPLTIRVNKENLAYLCSDEGYAEAEFYDDRVGRYVKAVVEEYCRQPYVVRERYYFRDNWNETVRAIRGQNVLRLKLRSRERQGRNNVTYMKPLCLEQDFEHMYHYLAGMVGPTQGGPWEPGAIRLTSVLRADCQEKAGILTNQEKKQLRAGIASRGLQFLSTKAGTQRVVVAFTETGEKMYRRILHLRPQYVAKNGLTYEFDCTKNQAEMYFFKFGHNARIVKPQCLADLFLRKYQSAARCYQKEEAPAE